MRPARVGRLLAALSLLAMGGTPAVPWPGGAAPTDAATLQQMDEALELHELERFEEYLEAWEKGEDSEHIFVLQEEIDAGTYDLDRLFVLGDALFGHEFRPSDGWGDAAGVLPLRRVHDGRRGGLDTFSCAGCHSVGGADGAGAATQNAFFVGDGESIDSALVRNAPAAIGLGFVQALAAEMTIDLQLLRDDAVMIAADTGERLRVDLVTKGVSFGAIEVAPDGAIDFAALEGVDRDLVVKPFGWKGTFATLRRVIENAALVHFGVQSHVLAAGHQLDPDPDRLGDGPDWFDPDGDGRARELEEGILTAGAVYLALLESPQIIPPGDPALRDRWARGQAYFEQVGCGDCHRSELVLIGSTWREYSDTTDAEPVTLNLLSDGEGPKAGPRVQLFSDLKRHDMGEGLADPHPEPGSEIPVATFLTRPLWGLAESPPYLHDGRAATIVDAIVQHGGEATASRDAFVALSEEAQADLHVFLLSLSRAPRLRVPR
jgi:mono/diheme cytochrome c family protein